MLTLVVVGVLAPAAAGTVAATAANNCRLKKTLDSVPSFQLELEAVDGHLNSVVLSLQIAVIAYSLQTKKIV